VNINRKLTILLVLSFLMVSAAFTANSIVALQKSQADNLKLFKEEFLELGRESFENNSSLFFSNLDAEVNLAESNPNTTQTILNFIQKTDPEGQNVVIVNTENKQFLENYNNPSLTSIFDQATISSLIEKYLKENLLNQKTEFDLDNFTQFNSDSSNTIVPKKIHFRIYNNSNLMVGFGQDFLSVKVRIEFIERQNEILFKSQLYSSLIILTTILSLVIILMIFSTRKIVLIPLNKIVEVVKQIAAGDLSKQVEVKSKDEIGQLGLAFNEMTSELKESYGILESKIEERTKELQDERGSLEKKVEERTAELEGLKASLEKTVEERTQNLNTKVLELEQMNTVMIGRELKMLELKKELKEIKTKKGITK